MVHGDDCQVGGVMDLCDNDLTGMGSDEDGGASKGRREGGTRGKLAADWMIARKI